MRRVRMTKNCSGCGGCGQRAGEDGPCHYCGGSGEDYYYVEIDWDDRIEQARERACFTEDDRDKAETWRSCAVGERIGGLPADEDLKSLGQEFYDRVKDDDVDGAEETKKQLDDF